MYATFEIIRGQVPMIIKLYTLTTCNLHDNKKIYKK